MKFEKIRNKFRSNISKSEDLKEPSLAKKKRWSEVYLS